MGDSWLIMYNALTIDVEDYYMVSAFADVVKFEDWHSYESRVEKNTYRILNVLDEFGVKATFFILGWIGEHFPSVVKEVHAAGHEIGSHGYNHKLVYHSTPDEFREDIRKSKSILEDIIGDQVMGYRAASYSIVKNTLWALDVLVEEGFLYDSSIFPIHHDRYGFPESERFFHIIRRDNGAIAEFPPTTYRIFGQNIPVAGGGYMRLFPLKALKKAIRDINTKEGKSAVLYLHPWEVDIEQPRLNGNWKANLRHYINLKSTMPKMRTFLSEFKFRPLKTFLDNNEFQKAC